MSLVTLAQLVLFLCSAIVAIVAIVAPVRAEESLKARYDEYHVYRLEPKVYYHLEFLHLYERYSRSVIFADGIHSTGQFVDVVVAPHRVTEFERAMALYELPYKLLESDFERTSPKNRTVFELDRYNRFNNSRVWLHGLERDFPSLVKVVRYGRSYEQRELLCIRISAPIEGRSRMRRDAIFIEAGINGQEWIGPAAALFIINELLTSPDKEIYRASRNYDWYIAPFVNPDGYDYTQRVDRLWRKTRTRYGEDYGANMNLNWDYHWGTAGASNYTCSTNYPGKYPGSERETEALKNYLLKMHGVKLYIALHSFGQTIQYPYADNTPPHDDLLTYRMGRLCVSAQRGMQKRHGTKYACNNHKSEPMSGTSTDYVYSADIAPLVFSFLLRPERKYYTTGYQLPVNEIVPTAQETLDGIVELIKGAERMRIMIPDKVPEKVTEKVPEHSTGKIAVESEEAVSEQSTPATTTTTARAHIIHDELF